MRTLECFIPAIPPSATSPPSVRSLLAGPDPRLLAGHRTCGPRNVSAEGDSLVAHLPAARGGAELAEGLPYICMINETVSMTVVQARLPELEYELLRRKARSEGRAIQDVVREAIRSHVMPDSVNPKDPIFVALPPVRASKGADRSSERIDALLYGGDA